MRSPSPLRVLIVAHQTADSPQLLDVVPRKVRALGFPVSEVLDKEHHLSDLPAA